jgi:hypothetical protein
MAASDAARERPFDTLQTLLATARELTKAILGDTELERLVRAFRSFPEQDRPAILQVLEKDAAWRRIVACTESVTGIAVVPNPHASLYVHVLDQPSPPPIGGDTSARDADVIRLGLQTFVGLIPLLFQEAVYAQWTAAARDIVRSASAEARQLAVRLAREVEQLVGDSDGTATT